MKEKTVIVTQEVRIRYNSEEAKQKCIETIKKDTNWCAFSEGVICNERLQFGGSKLPDIKVTY